MPFSVYFPCAGGRCAGTPRSWSLPACSAASPDCISGSTFRHAVAPAVETGAGLGALRGRRDARKKGASARGGPADEADNRSAIYMLDGHGDHFNGSQKSRTSGSTFYTMREKASEPRRQPRRSAALHSGRLNRCYGMLAPAHPWSHCQIGSGRNHEPVDLWGRTTVVRPRPVTGGL